MPLPIDTPLLVNPTGGPVQSKPKHAVLVSLSLEALQALEEPSLVRVDFEFGDQPGIHIGDRFFSISRQTEDIRHELYLRAATANKPNPPLRHHATITGKLEVTRRLGNDLSVKLRNTREQQRQEQDNRRIIVMDNPPEPIPHKKKKEPPSILRKPVTRPVAETPPPPPPPSALQRSAPGTPQTSGVAPLRARLIHFIARGGDRTLEEIVKALGGEGDSAGRREIIRLMEELAEQIPPPGLKATEKPDPANCKWRLRPKSWLEVKPWDWPKLSETERTAMARAARQACSYLKVPQSDPLWQYFQFRQSGEPSQIVSAPSDPPKRGVSSTQVKTRKTKVIKEIQIRDETRVAAKAPSVPPPPSPSGSSTSRKPGSGYKLSRQPSQDLGAGKPRPSDPRLKNQKPVPVPEPDKDRRKEKDRGRHEQPQEIVSSKRREKAPEKERYEPNISASREHQRSVDRVDKGKERETSSSSLKRKARSTLDDTASSSTSPALVKRRKIEQDSRQPSLPPARSHNLQVPTTAKVMKKEPSPQPSLPLARPNNFTAPPQAKVVKKESSPLPPARPPPSHSAANSFRTNGVSKNRRKSPVYTSSEDEDLPVTLPTPPTPSYHSRKTSGPERSTLRTQYSTKYVEYMSSYTEILRLKAQIERMLDNQSSGTITDSELEIDSWDASALTKRHNDVKDELESIRQVYERRAQLLQ